MSVELASENLWEDFGAMNCRKMVSGGDRADRDRGDRYVEIFLYSERPNKLRFKKTAFGGEYDHEAEQEIEALGVTKQKVLDECRQHMGMPGKSPLLLSMLGVALSPGSRLYLKKTDQGLKHFLAQHPQEFYVDGSKGREVITYLRAPGNKLGLPEFAVDPAQVPASAGALPPKANMEVPKVTLQLPSNEPASDCMTAESPKNMGNRYLPTSPLPPGSVGSNCGNLGTRRGNASNGPATGNLSDLGGFPPTPGWDDMVPPESPKATNLLPTDQTPVCTNHPGMQTPSDWGTPWDSVKPWDVRHPAKLGGQTDLNSMGAGPSTDNGATGPNMFTQAWSAWGMPPPAMWPGQAGAFSAGSDASQEALQNLLQMSGGMPSADPSQGVPAALLSYLAMGNPQGGLPNATWMDMNQLHAMQSGQPQALAPQQREHMADHDAPAKMEASEAPAAIRLRGLPYEAGEQDILAWMAKYDVVDRIMECKQAVRIYSKNNGKPMGLAVIAMNSKEDAVFVRQALHGQYMGNRYIEVFPHLEGEAGTDKATVQGSTAGATGGTGACNGGVQGRTEMRVEAEAFEGAGDTGGSGGSGGMPQGMMSNMPMWPGAPGTMGCMSGCMPYAGGDAQIDPFSQ
ncbi:esrp1, partial [Symbiodinium microadriaticum]